MTGSRAVRYLEKSHTCLVKRASSSLIFEERSQWKVSHEDFRVIAEAI